MGLPQLGLTGYVLAAQGVFGIFNGSMSLLSSSAAQSNADSLGIPSIAGIHAIGLGSISIGVFYVNAALRRDKKILPVILIGRVVAAAVFWSHGGPWQNVAIFEGVCAAVTKLAIVWEEWCETKERHKAV